MDLDPSQPSFKGEYEEDAFPTSDADPLSVLAYAGRMVDRASDRSREGRAMSSEGTTISELGSVGVQGAPNRRGRQTG